MRHSVALGWYGSRWIVELEAGFDKAIITQLNHTDAYKVNYAGLQDSWYITAGGNCSTYLKSEEPLEKIS